jgi:dUTP pyrophosphatase
MFDKKFNIKIRRLDKQLDLPSFSKPFDSGIDLKASHAAKIKPGIITPVKTGLYVELPDPSETFPFVLEMQIRPRSGLAMKNGIIVANTPGTIDNQYRGEIIVLLTKLKYASYEDNYLDYLINIGDRIAQAVFVPILSTNMLNIIDVDELNKTTRGSDGFGSTGIN